MEAKLSVEITEDKDGVSRAAVSINASNDMLRVAWLILSRAVGAQLNMDSAILATLLVGSDSFMAKHTELEAVIDMGAIQRAREGGRNEHEAGGSD